MKKYIGKLQGELREIDEPYRWAWAVLYKNGQVIRQFEDDMTYRFIGEIDQPNVLMFTMYEFGKEENRIDIVLPEGAKLIHRIINTSLNGPNNFQRTFVCGYKTKHGHTHANFILPSNQIVQCDNLNLNLADFLGAV